MPHEYISGEDMPSFMQRLEDWLGPYAVISAEDMAPYVPYFEQAGSPGPPENMADFAALLSERGIHLHGNLVGFYRLADGCWVIRQLLDEEIDQAFLDEEPEPSTLEEWIAQVDAMLSELMAMRRGAEMEGPEDAEADEGQARR